MPNLNRRIFLRGLGGAVVAAPFLGSVFERAVKAQPSAPVKRTIVMFTQYGCITNKWFPAKLDGELTAADLLPTTLAPLAPYAKKLLMPRGMRKMNEWTGSNTGAGRGRGQGNDIHIQGVASALTCQPVSPNSNDPFSFNQATRFNAMAMGPSLDHVLAQQLSPEGTPLLMSVAGQLREGPSSAISYSAADSIFRLDNATGAYARLTGLFDPNSPLNPDSWAMTKGKLIADIVKDDLTQLSRQDMSKEDKHKLAAWLELTNQVGGVIAASQCSGGLAMVLGASNALATGEGDAVTRRINATMDNADLYSAIAALTAACNANPVIVLKYPGNFIFSGLGINADSDNLNHRLDNADLRGTCVANVIDHLLKIDGYYAHKFAKLVQLLDGIPVDGGTVLDNTVAVWMMENSDGSAHNANNSPVIQAGSGGGYFKTGKIVDLDSASGATAEQMLGRSLAQCAEGTDMMVDGLSQVTGTDPRFGNAPINKYFCNIMNAMGIKADAFGYPAGGGPEKEVTHFGYSDKTEDFCGGAGAVPDAKIHSPGGFSELEA